MLWVVVKSRRKGKNKSWGRKKLPCNQGEEGVKTLKEKGKPREFCLKKNGEGKADGRCLKNVKREGITRSNGTTIISLVERLRTQKERTDNEKGVMTQEGYPSDHQQLPQNDSNSCLKSF